MTPTPTPTASAAPAAGARLSVVPDPNLATEHTPHPGSSGCQWCAAGTGLVVGSDPDAIRTLGAAINNRALPGVYVHDGAPVLISEISRAPEVATGDDDVPLPVTLAPLRADNLAGLFAAAGTVHKHRTHPKTGAAYSEEITPAKHVLCATLATTNWPGLPTLRGIISTPVLRADGTLLQTPGYDPATSYYLAGRVDLPHIPDQPSRERVAAARDFLLNQFLADFPWRSAADRANYIALLVTPILRPFTRTLAPFAIVDATMPGSGKTILTCCVGLLVGQRVLTWTESDEELRKSITTVLADPAGVIVFDNLTEGTSLASPVLARLVTERTWTDRKLGTNHTANYPNDRLWCATGNNLRTGGDMASRTIWVRLDPNCPAPEARTGFTIPHLDNWILDTQNQATILEHLLILIVDWTSHGAPTTTNVPAMRQFTKWASHLGGFLHHHNIPDFLTNHRDTNALDSDQETWTGFLGQWHTMFGEKPVTSSQLYQSSLSEFDHDPWHGQFLTTTTGTKIRNAKSLGKYLTGNIDRWHGNTVLRSAPPTHGHPRTYTLEHAPPTPPHKPPTPPT